MNSFDIAIGINTSIREARRVPIMAYPTQLKMKKKLKL
jgi:hypothetical protein